MKQSARAMRMARHHKRMSKDSKLSLVSLMDIFTILVFFLLVNSGEGEVLPTTRNVDLPESIAEQKPRENVVVMVTEHDILVQGSRIAVLKDVNDSGELLIDPLKAALISQNKRRLIASNAVKPTAPEVTIMGNKESPYRLLKKVMATCTEAGFGKISVAVMQKTAQES